MSDDDVDEMTGVEMWQCMVAMHVTPKQLARRFGSDDSQLRQMTRGARPIPRNLAAWLRLHRQFNEAFARPIPWGETTWRPLTIQEHAKKAEMMVMTAAVSASHRLEQWTTVDAEPGG